MESRKLSTVNAQPEKDGRFKAGIVLRAAGDGSGARAPVDVDRNLRSMFLDSLVDVERDFCISWQVSNITHNMHRVKMPNRFAASAAVLQEASNLVSRGAVRGSTYRDCPNVPPKAFQWLHWGVSRSHLLAFGQAGLRESLIDLVVGRINPPQRPFAKFPVRLLAVVVACASLTVCQSLSTINIYESKLTNHVLVNAFGTAHCWLLKSR
jgi:hypothetical protein